MKKPAKPTSSSATIRRLRRRLQEAEDTLQAIREGQVEALVVQSPDGEQIFTLRGADQPYRLMVEQMREGALTLVTDGTILYCNRRFAEMVGTAPERITGKSLSQFIEREDFDKLQSMLTSEEFSDEFQLRVAAGATTSARLSATVMNIDEVRTVAVVVTDLTQERTERGLRESNRLKDEFLATLSHELRTPLNIILGWTRMLLAGHLSDGARQHALELIDRNAQAQAQLVNDLVDMSRVTTGKLRLELEPLPVVPILDAALESVRPAAAAKSLTIDTSWTDRDLNVLADATRLQQVLWNLLSNAIKFTPAGGHISVKAAASDDHVRIEVADSGIGIDTAFLPHVFDRFRQADSGRTRIYGGLGLGLAIVKDLVQLQGGDVDVHSEGPGRGATFGIRLRLGAGSVAMRERRRHVRLPGGLTGYLIMFIEDHEDSRALIAQALQTAGATVAAFRTASDALAALERVRPSVIVADIGPPHEEEDGYAFIERVRSHAASSIRAVPAIAVTAYSPGATQSDPVGAGFQRHLRKPIDPQQLVLAIQEVMRRHIPEAPAGTRRASAKR